MFQAIVLGVLQGATELFPISSLGHTVLFPDLFGWHNIVALAVAARVAVARVRRDAPRSEARSGSSIYFWRDWLAIIGAFFGTLGKRSDRDADGAPCVADRRRRQSRLGFSACCSSTRSRVALAKPELAASIFLVDQWRSSCSGAERARRTARRFAGAGGPRGNRRPTAVAACDTLEFREAGRDRRRPVHRADRRDQPRRHVMATGLVRGLTTATRPGSRSCWPRPRSSRPGSTRSATSRGRTATAGTKRCAGRGGRCRDHRDHHRSFPHALLQDAHPDPFGIYCVRVRARDGDLQRVSVPPARAPSARGRWEPWALDAREANGVRARDA